MRPLHPVAWTGARAAAAAAGRIGPDALAFDAAFPVLHGKNGEDGTVQGLLELAGVPLVGCGTLSSALCMDKDRAHRLAALPGCRCPGGRSFRRGADSAAAVARRREALGYPLFVKPVRAGSSFGVTRVAGPGAAGRRRWRPPWPTTGEVLLEEAVPGFEVGCAVLGKRRPHRWALVDEIELSGGFFDFEEKYTLKTSAIHCPARISPGEAAQIQETGQEPSTGPLDCRGFARVDLFLTPEGALRVQRGQHHPRLHRPQPLSHHDGGGGAWTSPPWSDRHHRELGVEA